jgi:hypothetical protein
VVCCALPVWAQAACAPKIRAAEYAGPTDRYPHGALGDPLEWSGLRLSLGPPPGCSGDRSVRLIALPDLLVFEDVAPRLADLDGDGGSEVIVVESHRDRGARLAVWGLRDGTLQRIAQTAFIGTRFRWMAPIGAADLDGDGLQEIAVVDRPHLAKVLRIWRFEQDRLVEVGAAAGFSNHRFGDQEILGGIRNCGAGPEMVTASGDWTRVLATRFREGELLSADLGSLRGAESLDRALACRAL